MAEDSSRSHPPPFAASKESPGQVLAAAGEMLLTERSGGCGKADVPHRFSQFCSDSCAACSGSCSFPAAADSAFVLSGVSPSLLPSLCRTKLEQCCNASFFLILTKENTPLGSYIVNECDGKKLLVNSELLDMLPKRLSLSYSRTRRCAVVGSGGILLNSRCGQEIDQADLIIRLNLPPMNFSEDVGTKTSLVTINPSIIELRYKGLQARRKPFVDSLRPYKDALFLIPSFTFEKLNAYGYLTLYTMEDFGLFQQTFFLNPKYLASLGNYWKQEGLEVSRLSTGFMFASIALEFCEHLTLYGFWPFPYDLSNQPLSHHYYDNKRPHLSVHDMPREFSHFLRLYAQGVLRLQLGKCQ
uniref:Uncharacterized protein n=1 Tax=Salvator merianae TaxID=96440 RepID=A0A8D0C5B3_SALMN